MTKAWENMKTEYENFFLLPDKKRWDVVCELLNFFIAGEKHNKQLLFLLLLGNYHDKLKSFVLYRGDSSAGKNYVVQNVLQLFPKNDAYIFDSATAVALNYDVELDGVKTLYLRELMEKSSMVDLLKTLYNEDGKIHKETIKDKETKEHIVKTHVIERMGIVTTFSFEDIQIDVINRSWVLVPDQTTKQTNEILDHHLKMEANLIEHNISRKKRMNQCEFIAQCVKCIDFNFEVYIPFVQKLKTLFPVQYLNVRRDFNKLLMLIKILALWNQKNRDCFEISDKKYIIANYIDLEMALEISEKLFINLVLHIDEIKRSVLDFMEDKIEVELESFQSHIDDKLTTSETDRYYSITEVFEELRIAHSISRKTIQRKMTNLFHEGYLLREKQGSAYKFHKLRSYNLVEGLKLYKIREEIESLVEQKYIYYKNKSEEILDYEYEEEEEQF